MNLGIRTILFIAAIICFVIAIFSDVHWPDWMAIGLALVSLPAGAPLAGRHTRNAVQAKV